MNSLVSGLAVGFVVYWLSDDELSPKSWIRFKQWWMKTIPWRGKPFSCDFCMSFWLSVIFILGQIVWNIDANSLLVGTATTNWRIDLILNLPVTIITILSSAAVSLLFAKTLRRVETVYWKG